MKQEEQTYNIILDKIKIMKSKYYCLKDKSDNYVFSAVCLNSNFYKNPSLQITEEIIKDSIVDGVSDGGVDILLSDPNTDTCDMVICQSKFYKSISYDEVAAAIGKMISFYKDMEVGNFEKYNQKVQMAFTNINAEIGEESKIKFVFYTSAPKNGIRIDRLNKLLNDAFEKSSKYELYIYFGNDIVEEIKEAESRRQTVEKGELDIDEAGNFLAYGEDAAIVNISAFSLKTLYARYSLSLLARNLRYYIKKKEIDEPIKNTIRDNSEQFWFRNNGITIVCKDFKIDGKKLKLYDFSIVNGGQTTTIIHKSEYINVTNDFYLPCKVIKTIGNTEDEKNKFSLEIAKATNSQKAISNSDLKANAPEQVRFVNAMREEGIYYQTKRGEIIPKDYSIDYKNTDLSEVGKLCLAGIFQLPASSRNKPSTMYDDKYYHVIFDGEQNKVAKICRDLLYVDHYFKKVFVKRYDKEYDYDTDKLPFAHNARTICLSFISLAARINLGDVDISSILKSIKSIKTKEDYERELYHQFKNMEKFTHIFDEITFASKKDEIDSLLYEMFSKIINEGYKIYQTNKRFDPSINETNFLKKDENYYNILLSGWPDLKVLVEAFKVLVKETVSS